MYTAKHCKENGVCQLGFYDILFSLNIYFKCLLFWDLYFFLKTYMIIIKVIK